MAVNTKTVAGRRQIHFANLDEIVAEVERLAASKHHTLGNWSLGQILAHLAVPMNGSIDGLPFKPGFLIRLLGPLMKGRMLKKGMPVGIQLPADAAKSLVPPPTDVEEGLKKFRDAVRRQKTETHREPSPFMGKMTNEEWEQLHCRHAELHLSFVVPEE